MSRIRVLAVVVLLALLAASAAQALPARPAAPETTGFFTPFWSWVAGWLAPADGGAQPSVAAKSVAEELPDPAHFLTAPPNPVPTKDPTGGRLPNPGDAGGEMDPNG